MRRWNGWGEEATSYPLPSSARRLLAQWVGPGTPPRDAGLEEVLATVPPSRLSPHPLISLSREDRVRHARGQGISDWIALRNGKVPRFPDGVAYPENEEQVLFLLGLAGEEGAKLIPYGGGTSVLGHINPAGDEAPVLTVDLSRLGGLKAFDPESRLAVFGAGTFGPALEAQLRTRGFTLGHFPQSFEFSTLGGWVSTRSSGQRSLGYGRMERLFSGGRLITPEGILDIPSFPASAAGPDLREMVLGSEGRLGVLTEVSVRVSPLPPREDLHAVFFPDFEGGVEAARELVQAGLPLSMLRLSNAEETATTLALAGHRLAVSVFERILSFKGAKKEKSLLLLGLSGRKTLVVTVGREALGIIARHKGVHGGGRLGRLWEKNRFRAPYLRNSLWEAGYGVDTVETAVLWTKVPGMIKGIESALRAALSDRGERVHVFSHLSHLYPQGSSIYTTVIFRLARTPEETRFRWEALKRAASEAIVLGGGTISHHHGVGKDHIPYLSAEKGPLGMEAIRTLARCFDPKGVMNPGTLFQE
jgi:alkyldihydroxyacetonephosphate synthase